MTHAEEIAALQTLILELDTTAARRQSLIDTLNSRLSDLNDAVLEFLADAPESVSNFGALINLQCVQTSQGAAKAVNVLGNLLREDKQNIMRTVISRMDPSLREILGIPNAWPITDLWSGYEAQKWSSLQSNLSAIVSAG